MHTRAAGQLAHLFHGRLAALAHDVCGAEVPGKRDAVGVVPQDDDLVSAKAPGGDDAAQPDGPVPDYHDLLSWLDACDHRGVMAGSHHIGQRQERGDQGIVFADR